MPTAPAALSNVSNFPATLKRVSSARPLAMAVASKSLKTDIIFGPCAIKTLEADIKSLDISGTVLPKAEADAANPFHTLTPFFAVIPIDLVRKFIPFPLSPAPRPTLSSSADIPMSDVLAFSFIEVNAVKELANPPAAAVACSISTPIPNLTALPAARAVFPPSAIVAFIFDIASSILKKYSIDSFHMALARDSKIFIGCTADKTLSAKFRNNFAVPFVKPSSFTMPFHALKICFDMPPALLVDNPNFVPMLSTKASVVSRLFASRPIDLLRLSIAACCLAYDASWLRAASML